MHTREVNGIREVWEDDNQRWRPATWRDLKEKWPTQPPLDKTKFLCPTCSFTIEIVTTFKGWEVHSIDPEDGERVDCLDTGQDDIIDEVYRCASGTCNWAGGYSWWESINEAQYQEDKKEEVIALDLEAIPIQPGLFDTKYASWPPTSEPVVKSEDFWASFWGEAKITVGRPDQT